MEGNGRVSDACITSSVTDHYPRSCVLQARPIGVAKMSKSARLTFWEIGESEGHGFESGPRVFDSWLIQTNDFKIDTCCSLAWHSALLG